MGMWILAGLVVFGLVLWGFAVFIKKRNNKIRRLKAKYEFHSNVAHKLEQSAIKSKSGAEKHRASAQIIRDELSVMGVKVD